MIQTNNDARNDSGEAIDRSICIFRVVGNEDAEASAISYEAQNRGRRSFEVANKSRGSE